MGHTVQIRLIALWIPQWSFRLTENNSALVQILGILSWRKQEVSKSQNQVMRTAESYETITITSMEYTPRKYNPNREVFLTPGA